MLKSQNWKKTSTAETGADWRRTGGWLTIWARPKLWRGLAGWRRRSGLGSGAAGWVVNRSTRAIGAWRGEAEAGRWPWRGCWSTRGPEASAPWFEAEAKRSRPETKQSDEATRCRGSAAAGLGATGEAEEVAGGRRSRGTWRGGGEAQGLMHDGGAGTSLMAGDADPGQFRSGRRGSRPAWNNSGGHGVFLCRER